jgi:hypothetical protein
LINELKQNYEEMNLPVKKTKSSRSKKWNIKNYKR